MNKLQTVLERMLSVQRPHGGVGEGSAIVYLASIAPAQARAVWVDGIGNLHIDMRKDKRNTTLFVAHVDTMARKDGPNPFTKDAKGFYGAPKGQVLGADDGAGVAILSVLMGTVPAYYVFCRGEERGGIGSSFLAESHPDLLSEFDRAIAFDRRGYSDVITHQAMGRCASDEFGEALSDQLNAQGLLYMPSDAGIYTDTAEFVDIIPECTNISCGYANEHSDREELDGAYLQQLCDAALAVDWDALPVVRDPYEPKPKAGRLWTPSVIQTKSEPEPEPQYGLPPTTTPREHDIAEAFYMALEDAPHDLMEMVAKYLRVTPYQLDEELFVACEVYAMAQDCGDWEVFVEAMADECVSQMPH